MVTLKRFAFLSLASVLVSLPAAAQTDEQLLESLDTQLKAVPSFEYGQDSQALLAIERLVFALPADSAIRSGVEQRLLRTLDAATSNDAKRFLCTQLRVIGTKKSVPHLAKLLIDPATSSMAIYAMGRLEGSDPGKALHAALDKTFGATQAGVINALGDRRFRSAKRDLLRLMRASNEDVVKRACARALGRIGGNDVVEPLLKASKQAQGSLALEVHNALLQTADTMLADGNREKAAATYTAVIKSKTSPTFRLAAIRGLANTVPDQATALLTAEITRQDSPMRRDAIAATNLVTGSVATKAFAALLDKLAVEDKILMLRALGQRGDRAAASAIMATATHEDATVRLAALEALGGAGDVNSVMLLLVEAAGQGDTALIARRSLRLIPDKAVDQKLAELLTSDSEPAIAQAAAALAMRGHTPAIPQLLKLAKGDERTPRHAALAALGALASQQHLPSLLELAMAARTAEHQPAIVDAIARVMARTDAAACAAPIQAVLSDAPDAAKPTLILLLGRTGSPEALQTIRTGTTSADADIQEASIRALAQWPDSSVRDDLFKIIRTVDNPALKEIALAGFVRLANLSDDPAALFAQVLQQVTDTNDKKLLLAGLGLSAQSPAAIELGLKYLSEPELAPTAGLATLRIAHRLRNSHTQIARDALDQVMAKVDHDDVRRRAQEVINEMDKFADHILQWMAAGPYMEKGKDGEAIYRMVFDPEKPDAQNVKWKPLTKGIGTWDINLESEFGGFDHCAAYLRTRVWSPIDQEALMEMGSDDAVKTWLNGQLVFDKWTVQGAAPRQHKAKVSLKKGWNDLMLKAVDHEGGWVVACRLRSSDGATLDGLKIAAE